MKKFSSFLFVLLLMLASFTAQVQEYQRGDVNQDGAVNISDVTALIDNLLAGVPEGDVNQDGAANILDVTSLINYLLSGSWSDDPVTPPDDHDWVDLGLPSGTLWATCNVGAKFPEEYGDYFAWGEVEPKEVYDWSTYKWCNGTDSTMTKYCIDGACGIVDNKTVLEPEDDAAYVNWGPSWRMPSMEQILELKNTCTMQRLEMNGVIGALITGPNGNTVFFPLAGQVNGNKYERVGNYGYFWSTDLFSDDSNVARYIYFNGPTYIEWNRYRYFGFTIRAVRAPQN